MSELLTQLKHIRDFQINDLKKADEKASANFLVCVGCLNATEFLGGIRTGLLGKRGAVESRLRSGLSGLGNLYDSHVEDFLDLRNSMIHAYIGQIRNYPHVDIISNHNVAGSNIRVLPFDQGVQIVNGIFTVNVSIWIEDLSTLWSRVLDEIKSNPGKESHLKQILDNLPTLR